MAGRSRMRNRIDYGRLREAMAGPRSDTRSWIASARVDDEEDAVQWIDGHGWVADVTFISGELAGETAIPCRVMSYFGAPSEASIPPVARGAEVIVLVQDGDINVQTIIIGYLHNPQDSPLPPTVNGSTVDETYARDTMISVTSASLDAQFGPNMRVSASTEAKLLAPNVKLADDAATQPFVRGTNLQTALGNLSTALNVYAAALGGAGTATPVLMSVALPAATALAASLVAFGNAVTTALSTRIKGE